VQELKDEGKTTDEAEHINQFLADEEGIFQQYAQMCVQELKDEGKTTKPIELLLTRKEKLFD